MNLQNNSIKIFGRKVRMGYLRLRYRLKSVSNTFYMGGKSNISKDLIAKDHSYIGPNCNVGPKVEIGRYTMLANNVSILGSDHIFTKTNIPIIFSGRPTLPKTLIGSDVWVGAHTIILAGVSIGDGAIIGAGSVVTKNVPPYAIFAGVPAKFIRNRFDKEQIAMHKEMLASDNIGVAYCEPI